MNPHSLFPPHLLQAFPRGGRLPEGIPVALDPSRGEWIKHEPTTLIWREGLADGRQAVVKLYRRGLAVWCRGLTTGFRVKREFDGLSQLEKLGIPCSVPLFWCHGDLGPHGWGEILATEWVGQSQSLRDLLVTRPEVSGSLDLSPLFADLGRMHAAGLYHGMLNARNILVKNDLKRPVFVFIDLARFHRFPWDIRGTRMALSDLMVLCQRLLPRFPEEKVPLWLSAYGVPESEKTDLLIRLKRFRSTAFLRKVWVTEFNLRILMARFTTLFLRHSPEIRESGESNR